MITEQQVLQAARGQATITLLSRPCYLKLNKVGWEKLEQAQKAGYLAVRSHSDAALRSVWSLLSDARRVPDVKVILKARYAQVSADLMPAGLFLSDHGARLVEPLVKQHGKPRTRYPDTGTSWLLFDVRIESVTQVAAELVEILRDPAATENLQARLKPPRRPRYAP